VPANVLSAPSDTDFTPANLALFGNWANRDQGTMNGSVALTDRTVTVRVTR